MLSSAALRDRLTWSCEDAEFDVVSRQVHAALLDKAAQPVYIRPKLRAVRMPLPRSPRRYETSLGVEETPRSERRWEPLWEPPKGMRKRQVKRHEEIFQSEGEKKLAQLAESEEMQHDELRKLSTKRKASQNLLAKRSEVPADELADLRILYSQSGWRLQQKRLPKVGTWKADVDQMKTVLSPKQRRVSHSMRIQTVAGLNMFGQAHQHSHQHITRSEDPLSPTAASGSRSSIIGDSPVARGRSVSFCATGASQAASDPSVVSPSNRRASLRVSLDVAMDVSEPSAPSSPQSEEPRQRRSLAWPAGRGSIRTLEP